MGSLPHNASDGFYQCLLRLNAEKLQELFRLGVFSHRTCCKALADEGILAIESASVQGGDAAESSEPDPLLIAGCVSGALFDAASQGAWVRCRVIAPAGSEAWAPEAKVYFDNRHRSSRSRGYIECSRAGHEDCRKYAWCDNFSCRADLVAHLFAWLQAAPGCCSKHAHIACEPDSRTVATFRGTVHVADFRKKQNHHHQHCRFCWTPRALCNHRVLKVWGSFGVPSAVLHDGFAAKNQQIGTFLGVYRGSCVLKVIVRGVDE